MIPPLVMQEHLDDASRGQNGSVTYGCDTESRLHHICRNIHDRVTQFLQAELPDSRLKKTQEQTRKSLQVIREALSRYRYVAVVHCHSFQASTNVLKKPSVELTNFRSHT